MRVYRNKDPTKYLEWDILKFADHLCAGLSEHLKRPICMTLPDSAQILRRISNQNGDLNAPPSESQRKRGLSIGNCLTAPCYICKKYEANGKYNRTSWECANCGTPICLQDRSGKRGRKRSCLYEHIHSNDDHIKCLNDGLAKNVFPKCKKFRLV